MSEQEKTLQEKANYILALAFRGLRKVSGKIRYREYEVIATVCNRLATFDRDALTRLVVAAHDQCARVEIAPCNPRYLKIIISNRVRDSEHGVDRHPTLEEATESIRKIKVEV